jgi:hypothetical protein
LSIFQESLSPRARKGKVSGGRRTRISKKRLAVSFYFREPGPAAGLKLSYDPNDPLFPRRWVLSYNGLVLQVTRSKPTELWNNLTEAHREQARALFEPIPIRQQDINRRLADEAYKRMEFWERVYKHGRKHHSHLLLGPTDKERKEMEIVSGGRTTTVTIK